jgi:glycosyltransferase involved in cell wall biosynthesis
MRITIVTGPLYPVPPAPCGAVERLWHALAEEFARRGHAVTILCRGHETQAADETINGVRFVRRTRFARTGKIGVDLAKDLAYSLRMAAALPPADVTVTNAFWLPFLAGLLRRGTGKLVVAVHRYPKHQMRLYYKADRFAVVSTAIRNEIAVQFPSAGDRVRVFPNPIDTSVFVPPERPRTFDGEKAVVYTGRVHPEKGIHLLVDAFGRLHASMPETRLRVVGPTEVGSGGGGEDYLRSLKQKAGSLPVEFLGPVYDRRRLAELLWSGHCYTYPSMAPQGEALPVAPIEAMATGLVPVVSDMTCFDDYLVDGETGYRFDYRGEGAAVRLAEALRKVLADPAGAAAVGANAARKAATFSNANVAETYLRDFESLAGIADNPTTGRMTDPVPNDAVQT